MIETSKMNPRIKWPLNLPSFLLILIILLLGITLRFYNLDHKVYWIDEFYTSFRISGHTEADVVQEIFNGEVIEVKNLQKYQFPNPEKDVSKTIYSLALESPQHPPLYYLMARFWVKAFGESVTTLRSLSAWISLLTFPAIYWLCLELFQLPLAGWLAIAFVAVSPFHLLYAQEAREYSLWMVTILLSSAALLHAIKQKNTLSWVIYFITLTLNLYTFLFSIFIAIFQGIYVLITEKFCWNQNLKAYFLATSAGILTFSPWLWVIISNINRVQTTAEWTTQKVAFGWLLQRWLINTGNVFFDLNWGYQYLTLPVIAILILIIYSLYFLVHRSSKPTTLFLLLLTFLPAFFLVLPDIVLGGLRSTTARYLIPSYLGIQLSVAYLLATKLTQTSNLKQKRFWKLIFITVISGSILSCLVSSQAQFWWTKSPAKNQHFPEISHIINQANQPLVISNNFMTLGDCFSCRMLSFSQYLNPNIKLQLVLDPKIPEIPNTNISNIFVFSPSESFVNNVARTQNYQKQLVFNQKSFWLWKLIK